MLAELVLSLAFVGAVNIDEPMVDLSQDLIWTVDESSAMRPAEVLRAFSEGNYHGPADRVINLGFQNRPIFFLTRVSNQSEYSEFVLEFGYPLIDHIEIYLIRNGQIERPVIVGDLYPFALRHRPHRTPNLSVKINHQEELYLLFKVVTDSSVQFPLKLFTERAFGDHAAQENMVFGLYYGIIGVMVLFNLFMFFSLRDKIYLLYMSYLCLFLLGQMSLNGTLFQYIAPNFPKINLLVAFWLLAAFTFAQIFTLHFLGLDDRLPRLGRFLKYLSYTSCTLAILTFIIPYKISITTVTVWGILVPPLLLYAGISSSRAGYQPARFFILAWGFFLVGMVVYSLKSQGLLPYMYITEYSMQIGSAIEVVLLSLALGDRVHLLQIQRDQANSNLIDGYRRLDKEINRRETLELTNNNLQEQIKKSTEQLIQAEKMVLLGQMVAGVAHDFAGPSQLIVNSQSDTLQSLKIARDRLMTLIGQPEDSEGQQVRELFVKDFSNMEDALNDIKLATERIYALQGAIRNQSRIDEMKSNVQLAPIIDECLTILRPKIKLWRLKVELPENLTLLGRRSQIGQVMTNLLSNACDALREHGRAEEASSADIIIRARQVFLNTGASILRIEIEDNGPGIDQGKRTTIFEPFYTSKPIGDGTGLGLSICFKIIEDHGGSISVVDPNILKGACFRIDLPTEHEVIRHTG